MVFPIQQVRHEFRESVAHDSAQKPDSDLEGDVARGRRRIRPPSVRNQNAPWHRDIAGISGLKISGFVVRHKSHLDDMAKANIQGLSSGSIIAGILAPQAAKNSF